MSTIVLGLDLGSRKCGIVGAVAPLPLSGIIAETIDVDPSAPAEALEALCGFLDASGASVAVLEWGRGYVSAKGSPGATAASASAIMAARDVMQELRVLFKARCAEKGIQVVEIQTAVWRSRIKVPTRDDAGVRAALERILTPEVAALLTDEHQRDACGAMLGWLMSDVPAEPRERKTRGRPAKPPASVVVVPPASGPSAVERAVAAVVAHGRPIRVDVLSVRLAVDPKAAGLLARKAAARGLLKLVEPGVYGEPGWVIESWRRPILPPKKKDERPTDGA